MANVLPTDTLRAVRNSHRARFVLVGSLVAIVCGAIALLALLPAYAIVSAGKGDVGDSLVSLPPSTDRDDITRAQTLVSELRQIASSTVSALIILDQVLSARPKGVVISSVRYARGSPGTILISGVAPSRDEINAYRALLSEDPRFENVSVPIGTLAGSGDGNFNMTLTGTF